MTFSYIGQLCFTFTAAGEVVEVEVGGGLSEMYYKYMINIFNEVYFDKKIVIYYYVIVSLLKYPCTYFLVMNFISNYLL